MKVLIGKLDDFPEGKLSVVVANGIKIVVAHTSNGLCAVDDACPHEGAPLSEGHQTGDSIICPWHQSKFHLCTGSNLDWVRGLLGEDVPAWSDEAIQLGGKPESVTTYRISVEGEAVYAEL